MNDKSTNETKDFIPKETEEKIDQPEEKEKYKCNIF
jgi:hypothetical protein